MRFSRTIIAGAVFVAVLAVCSPALAWTVDSPGNGVVRISRSEADTGTETFVIYGRGAQSTTLNNSEALAGSFDNTSTGSWSAPLVTVLMPPDAGVYEYRNSGYAYALVAAVGARRNVIAYNLSNAAPLNVSVVSAPSITGTVAVSSMPSVSVVSSESTSPVSVSVSRVSDPGALVVFGVIALLGGVYIFSPRGLA